MLSLDFKIPVSPVAGAEEQVFLSQVQSHIQLRCEDPMFGVCELASLMQVSRGQLHRKVRELTGQSPGRLIKVCRMRAAVMMLLDQEQSIKEIAYRIGFSEQASFSRAFQQEFNCSPTAFRMQAEADSDSEDEPFPVIPLSGFRWKVPIRESDVDLLIAAANEHSWLADFLRIVIANLGNERFSLDELAQQLNLSVSQLSRKLRELLHVSPARFVRHLRLQHAAELIQAGNESMVSIAYQSGFCDQAHFCKAFKAAFGCSPTAYESDLPARRPRVRLEHALLGS